MSRPKGSKNKPKVIQPAAMSLPGTEAPGPERLGTNLRVHLPSRSSSSSGEGEEMRGSTEPRPTTTTDGPALREYLAGSVPMRVGRFDLLCVEFTGFEEADLPRFQEVLSIHVRGWTILRRLFGIQPVIPTRDMAEDDLRTWRREELMEALGINAGQLREELDRLRGIWRAVKESQAKAEDGKQQTESQIELAPPAKDELFFKADALVRQCGMEELLHRDEIPWMASRLEACAKVINHSQVGEMMRHALLTELEIRRLQYRRAKTSKEISASEDVSRRAMLQREYDSVFKNISDLMKIYQTQVENIDKIFPFFKVSGGTANMKQVFSDAIECHAEWYRDGKNELADGIFTAAEIEVLMRMSVQSPEPQYRLDQVVYLNMARQFTWDPKWDGKFAPGTMKKLRAGFAEAAARTSQADGETLADLLSDDPIRGEYPLTPALSQGEREKGK